MHTKDAPCSEAATQARREEGRPRKDLKKLGAAAAQPSSCAKFATQGAYHANLSIFIYSAVTFNYKGHAPGCVNLHNPSYRRFIVPYTVQMHIVRTSPCPKVLVCPVSKESEGEIQCPGRRITAGHGHIGKPDFYIHSCWIWIEILCFTDTPFVWHPEPIAIMNQDDFSSLLQNKDPTIPRGTELNQALSARLWRKRDLTEFPTTKQLAASCCRRGFCSRLVTAWSRYTVQLPLRMAAFPVQELRERKKKKNILLRNSYGG